MTTLSSSRAVSAPWRTVLLLSAVLAGSADAGRLRGDVDHLVTSLEGAWSGEITRSPHGPMPFVLLFEREQDGTLHARTHRDRETYIDLRFVPGAEEGWTLVESAAMPGLGTQSRTLAPAAARAPGVVRFVDVVDASFLAIDVRHDEGALRMDVTLRGEPHAGFALQRLPDEAIPALRAQLAELAGLAPGADEAAAHAGEPSPTDALRAAREAVQARPDDAGAHLALGRALLSALAEEPARGASLGSQCLRALRRAAALDPTLAEPHRLLALYHLNAPAIGGGSKRRALEEARRFAELDRERGPSLLAHVERAAAAR